MVSEDMKQKSTLFAFKREIKHWAPENCPCRIGKNYLPYIGFIQHFLFLTIYILSGFFS